MILIGAQVFSNCITLTHMPSVMTDWVTGLCPTVTNMFDNTPTTDTNTMVRLSAWNIPNHTEHHVFPRVPFYLLPELPREVAPILRHTSPGSVAFTRDYVAQLKRCPLTRMFEVW
jgi:fatty acid desaturase